MIGVLSDAEMDSLLTKGLFARLGCHADGRTYVVPISYAFRGMKLFGVTTPGMKIEMMRKNPEVCLCVDEVIDLTRWKSVILWGRFKELDGAEAAEADGLLIDKYEPIFEELGTDARRGRDVTPSRLNGTAAEAVAYCIEISERTGRFEDGTPPAE